ncbi:AI-2E family transporter [Thiocystis violacea]|uniref:AI-2E family transporter n=1 Tax=Thiocystis violacea TaxID=13725 RepID=UPI0019067539|nr:AI-2E family transporter [Thiocystis violacea]MBK1720961.1 AI-2E family transporter [Thiocystis violacea]
MNIVKDWFQRFISDPQLVALALILLSVIAILATFGQMLAPVLASIVIAYLLEGLVERVERRGLPRRGSVVVIYVLFVLFLAVLLLGVLPLVSVEIAQLAKQLPNMLTQGMQSLMALPHRYPGLVTTEGLDSMTDSMRSGAMSSAQHLLSWSLTGVVDLITLLVYLVLMPMLVFFFLKDKELILNWFRRRFPSKHRGFVGAIWIDVDRQISNYVRGKAWEVLIAWVANFAVFAVFGLKYAMLLSLLVGLSVIIPYVGAAVVTVPVMLVAAFQWGWSAQLGWLAAVYFLLHALDGNVLVPLLYSEVVDLHPVAIIVAILIFGGIWGFWGVFFAIPLATLVEAILNAWPNATEEDTPTSIA